MKLPQNLIKYLAIAAPTLMIGTVVIESIGRRKFPESLFRPSNMMNLSTKKFTIFFTKLGHYFAKFTNLYTLMIEYFPVEDIRILSEATFNLVVTPFFSIKGYHDYYTASMTPVQYGLVSSAIVVGIGAAVTGYYFCPPTWTTQIRELYSNMKIDRSNQN